MVFFMKIGIIGTGIAGLTAGFVLQQNDHDVTLFERPNAHCLDSGHVDSPFRAMNALLWPNTLLLAKLLDIATYEVHSHMSCSWLNQNDGHAGNLFDTWLKTGHLGGLKIPIAMASENGKHLPTLAWGLYRFKLALQQLPQLSNDVSVQTWLNQQTLPKLFWQGCLLPVWLTLCRCDVDTLMQWPVKPLLCFCATMLQEQRLYQLEGGIDHLVETLKQSAHIIPESMAAVWQNDEHVFVKTDADSLYHFDHVIVATAHSKIDFLDAQQFSQELSWLQALPHTEGMLLQHTDTQLMPSERSHWASVNHVMSEDGLQHQFNVWLNPHQAQPVFQVWQPLLKIAPEHILQQTHLQQPVCSTESLQYVAALKHSQRHNASSKRVWFCGAWMSEGLPILETTIASALDVCENLHALWPRLPDYSQWQDEVNLTVADAVGFVSAMR